MERLLLRLTVSTLAVFAASYILPGVRIEGMGTAVVTAIVLGFVNGFVRPILILLTLPLTLLSLGLFLVVINAAMVGAAAMLVPGFSVAGFWWAVAFGFIVSLVSSVLSAWAEPF